MSRLGKGQENFSSVSSTLDLNAPFVLTDVWGMSLGSMPPSSSEFSERSTPLCYRISE
jgi:hypothetical protein